MTNNKKLLVALALLAAPLTGCDMYHEGSITEHRVQVRENAFSEDVMLADVNETYVNTLARHYTKHGDGGLDLTVTYDPRSYRNTAMTASQEAAKLSGALRSLGVDKVNANILPVHQQGDKARLLVSYNAYTAHAPEGCESMPGLDNQSIETNADYKLGCGIETMIAKQVARPKDLLGQENTDTNTEGRSASNIIETYRYGTKNEPLEGESASGSN